MYKYLIKNGFKAAVLIATAVAAIFMALALLTGPVVNVNSKGDYNNVHQFNFGLIMAIISFFTIMGISAFFTFRSIYKNKSSKSYLRKISIGLLGLFATLVIALRSNGNEYLNRMSDNHISSTINGFISSGIVVAAIATLVAVGLIIYLEISKFFKT